MRYTVLAIFALFLVGCSPPENTPECRAYEQYANLRNRMVYADIGTGEVDKHRVRYFIACTDSIAGGGQPEPDPVIPDPPTPAVTTDTPDDFTTEGLMLGLAASLVVLLFVVRGFLRSSAELKAAKKALDTLEVP